MNLKDIIKHPITGKAVLLALGALGMVGVQNTVPAVKQVTTTPQIIHITPKCPELPPLELVLPKR